MGGSEPIIAVLHAMCWHRLSSDPEAPMQWRPRISDLARNTALVGKVAPACAVLDARDVTLSDAVPLCKNGLRLS